MEITFFNVDIWHTLVSFTITGVVVVMDSLHEYYSVLQKDCKSKVSELRPRFVESYTFMLATS